MRFMLISDNHDTAMGLRLAGIDGVVTHDADGVKQALQQALDDENVGVVLITERLVPLCPDLVYEMKLNLRRPLIVEIPDRHTDGRSQDSIQRYIRDAIGVKF